MDKLLAPWENTEEHRLRKLEKHIRDGEPLFKSVFGVDFEPKDVLAFRSEKRNCDHERTIPFDDCDEIENDSLAPLNLNEELLDIFQSIIRAINNNSASEDRSYSKYLFVPLFKYTKNDPVLYISQLKTNTLTLMLKLHCFDWCQTYDHLGNEEPRYHEENKLIMLPFNKLNDLRAIDSAILQELGAGPVDEDDSVQNKDLEPLMMDIDDVEIMKILEYTIDVSEGGIDRKTTQKMMKSRDGIGIGGQKSFKADGEVITSRTAYDYMIKNSEMIQLLRMLMLLLLGNDYKSYHKLMNAYKSGELDRWIDRDAQDDQVAMNMVFEYLKNHINKERIEAVQCAYNSQGYLGPILRAYKNERDVIIPEHHIALDANYNFARENELYIWIKQLHTYTGETLFKNEDLYSAMKEIIGKDI